MDADKAPVMDQKLNKARKDDERPTTLKAAKDGKMYLPRGDYKVVYEFDPKGKKEERVQAASMIIKAGRVWKRWTTSKIGWKEDDHDDRTKEKVNNN